MEDYKPAKLHNAKGDINKRWYVYYSVMVDGKFKICTSKGGINKIKTVRGRTSEGNALALGINNLLKSGWRPKGSDTKESILLIDVLYKFIDLKKGLRRRTWQSYKYNADTLTAWIKSKHIDYFTPADFTVKYATEYFDHLQKKGYAGKSLNGHKSNLSVLFNMMVARELITRNPFSKVKKFAQITGRNIAYSDIQKLEIEAYLKDHNHNLYLFTQWIYYTCIRPIELLRLKVSNVDLKNKNIVIYADQSKNKKMESVVIPDAFVPILESMNINSYDKDCFLFGRGLKISPLSVTRNVVSMAHSNVLKALNYSNDYTLYSWKHTSVVNAFNAGINPYSIQRQLRHYSLDQTMTYLKSLGLLRNDEFGSKMK